MFKIFQQTVYSFKAFQEAIEDYSTKAEHYQADICRTPQSVNLTFTEGAFVFLVPAALFLAPGPWPGRLCGVCHELRLLRGVLRHYLHSPCQDHVCRIGHDAGWRRFGPH